RTLTCAAAAVLAASVATPPADGADATIRFAVVLPSGQTDKATSDDVAYGVSLAVAASNDAKAAGAKRPTVESTQVNAGDAQMTALAVEKAAKEKFVGAVVVASDTVA